MKTESILAVLIGAFLLSSPGVHAQDQDSRSFDNEQGTSMRPILADALPIVQQLEEEGMEIVKMDFDILSDVKTAYRELHEAWNYGIIAFGDYRFEDIDIEVFKDVDGSWVAIKSDTEAIPQAGVTVEPSATGTYRIDIKAYKFKEGFETGHYGLIIFHE